MVVFYAFIAYAYGVKKCNKYSFYILAFYQYMEVCKSFQNKTLSFDPCSLEEYCLVVNCIFFSFLHFRKIVSARF